MKLYLAGKKGDSGYIGRYAKALEEDGHEVVYSWWDMAWEPVKAEAHAEMSRRMIEAIEAADLLILIPPKEGGLGCFYEAGYAAGYGIPVVLLRDTATDPERYAMSGSRKNGRWFPRSSSFFHNHDLFFEYKNGVQLRADMKDWSRDMAPSGA